VQHFHEVWWIRHAESLGNAGFRTPQPGTFSLSERGFTQAAELGQWFEREPGLIVTSSFKRAQETAAPAIARHGAATVEEWPVHEISYLAPERCANTTEEERSPMARDFWQRNDPDYVDGPGAESFTGFIARVDAALKRARGTPAFTAVFTHGHFIRGIVWRALNPAAPIDSDSMQMFYDFTISLLIPNCVVLPMIFAADGTAFLGPLRAPLGVTKDSQTLEKVRLSGL
jgi:broad specificity phosphatase PhoE